MRFLLLPINLKNKVKINNDKFYGLLQQLNWGCFSVTASVRMLMHLSSTQIVKKYIPERFYRIKQLKHQRFPRQIACLLRAKKKVWRKKNISAYYK